MRFLTFILLFSLSIASYGQTVKKLKRLNQKKKWEKIIALTQKTISKDKADENTWYYLTKSQLALAWNDNSLSHLLKAQESYITLISNFNSPKSKSLKREFKRNIKPYLTRFDSGEAQKSMVEFMAIYCGDTVLLYDRYFNVTVDYSGEKRFTEVNEIGFYVPEVLPKMEMLISKSEEAMNTPWKMGGMEPGKGFDCSGFVIWSYGQFGYQLPHKTKLLAQIGEMIPDSSWQTGDIICFGSDKYSPQSVFHVGMIHSVIGDDINMIHCGTSKGVSIVKLSEGYWSEREFFVVRISEK